MDHPPAFLLCRELQDLVASAVVVIGSRIEHSITPALGRRSYAFCFGSTVKIGHKKNNAASTEYREIHHAMDSIDCNTMLHLITFYHDGTRNASGEVHCAAIPIGLLLPSSSHRGVTYGSACEHEMGILRPSYSMTSMPYRQNL